MTSDATPIADGQAGLAPALAAAVPTALAALLIVMFSVAEMVGRTWFSYGPERNLAEAAAMGRLSEVARLLRSGEDPRRIVAVRPHVISSSVTRVSALEAAVWHRSAALIGLFERAGALDDAATRGHLMCLARDLKAEEIVQYFQPHGFTCEPDATVAAITARSSATR
jgi:hypothetical protein